MKRLLAIVVLSACYAAAATLRERIEGAIAVSPAARGAFWGIQVFDLAKGETLFESNANRFFVPASNTMLFSTALALSRLGPDFRFTTRVIAETAPDPAGTVFGSIRLIGGGDPTLSARTLPYRMGPITGNPLAAIEDLADQIVVRGVRRIEAADELVNSEMCVPESEAVELEEDEFFDWELTGCRVETVEGDQIDLICSSVEVVNSVMCDRLSKYEQIGRRRPGQVIVRRYSEDRRACCVGFDVVGYGHAAARAIGISPGHSASGMRA